jgi:hypothetical protein
MTWKLAHDMTTRKFHVIKQLHAKTTVLATPKVTHMTTRMQARARCRAVDVLVCAIIRMAQTRACVTASETLRATSAATAIAGISLEVLSIANLRYCI